MNLESQLENKFSKDEREIFERFQRYKYEILRWSGSVNMGVGGALGVIGYLIDNPQLYSITAIAGSFGVLMRYLAYKVTHQKIDWFYKNVSADERAQINQ